MVEMNRIAKLVRSFQSVNSDGGKEITDKEKSQLKSIWESGKFEGTALTERESNFIQEMFGWESTSSEASFATTETKVKTKRFEHEDGSSHVEVFEEGKPRSYVHYDKNNVMTGRTETVLINGTEYPRAKYSYNANGDVTKVTIYEYDKNGNLQKEKTKDVSYPETTLKKFTKSEKTKQKTVEKALTPEQIKESRDSGSDVADKLIGATYSVDQEVVRLRMEKNNSKNVLEFLRGYQSNSKGGDSFFEQLRTEWSFPDKELLMCQTATYLKDYIIEKEGKGSPVAKEIEVILLEREFSKENAKSLDDIVKQYLEKYMN